MYIYYILEGLDLEKYGRGTIGSHGNLNKEILTNLQIPIPKNNQLMRDLEPTFQEIKTLKTEIKKAEDEYKRLIKELSQEAIPNQESQQDVLDTAPEFDQQIDPEVVDLPIQDEIVIKKKSSTKTARKLKSK